MQGKSCLISGTTWLKLVYYYYCFTFSTAITLISWPCSQASDFFRLPEAIKAWVRGHSSNGICVYLLPIFQHVVHCTVCYLYRCCPLHPRRFQVGRFSSTETSRGYQSLRGGCCLESGKTEDTRLLCIVSMAGGIKYQRLKYTSTTWISHKPIHHLAQ